MDQTERIIEDYRRLARTVDEATGAIRKRHPEEVRCYPGCDLCCHDFFQISILEAAVVRRAVRELPAEVQETIRRRVASLDARQDELGVGLGGRRHYGEEDWDAYGLTFSARQRLEEGDCLCPLNLKGECSIYESRPIVCRTFGYPMDGFFFGCPGGNFEDESRDYSSLPGEPIDQPLEELRRAYVAGTPLEGQVTDNRYMGAVDWEDRIRARRPSSPPRLGSASRSP